jgi:two-component system alkaline phosphatase synthesis response regulator PhoP
MKEEQCFQNGEPATVAGSTAPNARQRIMVVEDETDIRVLTAEVLRLSGYEVDAAEDGGAAWDALQIHKYDLLITDNRMPKMSGLELLAKIHEAAIPLPVIMASGTMPDLPSSQRVPLQIAAILTKPYCFEDLLTMVKKVLSKSADSRVWVNPPPSWGSRPQPDGA